MSPETHKGAFYKVSVTRPSAQITESILTKHVIWVNSYIQGLILMSTPIFAKTTQSVFKYLQWTALTILINLHQTQALGSSTIWKITYSPKINLLHDFVKGTIV